MARIRTIKPGFWQHEDLSELPEATHMLAAALLNYADDDGYFNANPRLVQAACCPLREPSVSVHDSLQYLSSVGYLRLGTGPDGKTYGHIVKFSEHQTISRKTDSKIKTMEIVWEDSRSAHGVLNERSVLEGKGREGKIYTNDDEPDEKPEPPPKPNGKHVPDALFDEFWQAYPSRGIAGNPKKPAKEKFAKLVRDGTDPAVLIAGAKGYAAACVKLGYTGDKAVFVSQATTFLNRAAWEQYQTGPPNGANGARAPDPTNEADARLMLEVGRDRLEWPASWGPMPGTSGCLIPAELIEPDDGRNWRAR